LGYLRTRSAVIERRVSISARLPIRLFTGWASQLDQGLLGNVAKQRAKYYELSKKGRQQLEVETDAWGKLTAAVAQVLGTA
jgi:hypothetical protein